MTPQEINPDLMLKAAEMAKPRPTNSNSPWEIWDGSHGKTISYMVFDIDGSISEHEEFNPLTSDSDAWALEDKLEREGWTFCWAKLSKDNGIYLASMPGRLVQETSRALRALSCVSAMTGIPVYRNSDE